MLKKLGLCISLLLGSTPSTYANLLGNGTTYLGPNIAYESISAGHVRYEAFVPLVVLGYRNFIDDLFYAGLEGFAGYTAATMLNHTKKIEEEFVSFPREEDTRRFARVHRRKEQQGFKNTYTYGLSVITGMKFDWEVLGYLRFGGVATHFVQPKANRWGLQTGVGLEIAMTYTWNVRGEFDYDFYKKIGRIGKPKEQQYNLALIYKFGCPSPSVC